MILGLRLISSCTSRQQVVLAYTLIVLPRLATHTEPKEISASDKLKMTRTTRGAYRVSRDALYHRLSPCHEKLWYEKVSIIVKVLGRSSSALTCCRHISCRKAGVVKGRVAVYNCDRETVAA